MSNKVYDLVRSRTIGSAAQKAVLLNMADRANPDGTGVFASKRTVSVETELSLRTVKREINGLLDRGLIREAGSRPCLNGHTVVYVLDLAAIADLPAWASGRRIGARKADHDDNICPAHSVTGDRSHPAHSVTGDTDARDPVHSAPLTLNEPPKEEEEEGAGARTDATKPKPAPSLVSQIAEALGFNDPEGIGWPRYWASADAGLIVSRWVTDLGLTEAEVIHVATANMRAHGSPANGPKTLTRHMQDYAAEKAAPPLEIPASRTGDPSHAQTARPSSRGQQSGSGQQFTGIVGAVMRNRLAREQGV